MVYKARWLASSRASLVASVITVALLWATVVVAGMNEDLMAAAYRGDLPEVQRLLAKEAEVNAKMDDGRTVLIVASYYGHLGVVQELLTRGAEVNAKMDDGRTALMIASQKGYGEVSALLIKAGAK